MAQLGFAFNPANFEPLSDYIAVPKGEWNAVIKNTEINTEKPDQPKLVLTFEIIEGACKGATLDLQLALWTPDDVSKKGGGWGAISRRKLRSVTDAVGIHGEFADTAVLHGKPLTITTDLRFSLKNDNSGQYVSFPEIKKFSPFVGQGRAAGADAVQPQAPAAGVGGAAAPTVPTLPAFGAAPAAPGFSAPAAPAGLPAFGAPQAPSAMPAGFQMPGQQTAPAAPAMAVPPMGGFAPPVAPAPAFAPPAMGGAAPWGVPQIPGR